MPLPSLASQSAQAGSDGAEDNHFEGYLDKASSKPPYHFQKRYFVIEGPRVLYFKDEKKKDQKGAIAIQDAGDIYIEEGRIILEMEGRRLKLRPKDENLLSIWKDKLEIAQQEAKAQAALGTLEELSPKSAASNGECDSPLSLALGTPEAVTETPKRNSKSSRRGSVVNFFSGGGGDSSRSTPKSIGKSANVSMEEDNADWPDDEETKLSVNSAARSMALYSEASKLANGLLQQQQRMVNTMLALGKTLAEVDKSGEPGDLGTLLHVIGLAYYAEGHDLQTMCAEDGNSALAKLVDQLRQFDGEVSKSITEKIQTYKSSRRKQASSGEDLASELSKEMLLADISDAQESKGQLGDAMLEMMIQRREYHVQACKAIDGALAQLVGGGEGQWETPDIAPGEGQF